MNLLCWSCPLAGCYIPKEVSRPFIRALNQEEPLGEMVLLRKYISCYVDCSSQSNDCYIGDRITECPSCKCKRIESMLISHGEIYTTDHGPKRGVTLGFSKSRT
jgi:hypothetical protein